MLKSIKELIGIRRLQPAFHPNATKHSLHTGEKVFSFWRQSPDHQQIIYCLHNVSTEPQSVFLMSMNLIGALHWIDLISGTRYRADDTVHLEPYQYVWLRNEERHRNNARRGKLLKLVRQLLENALGGAFVDALVVNSQVGDFAVVHNHRIALAAPAHAETLQIQLQT